MKKTLSFLLILAIAFSLAASVSAQTLDSEASKSNFAKEKYGDDFTWVQYIKENMFSDNTAEILSHLLSDTEQKVEYTVAKKTIPLDTEVSTLFGFVFTFESFGYEGSTVIRDTLDSDLFQIESLTCGTDSSHFAYNSVVIKRDAFELLSSDFAEYISNFETLEKLCSYYDSGNTFDEYYLNKFAGGETISWMSDFWGSENEIDAGEWYISDIFDVDSAMSIFTYSPYTVRYVFTYGSTYKGSSCDYYYMNLNYAKPDGADENDYGAYELESISLFADVMGFEGSNYEVSPQTGSSAALLTFLAVISLGVICSVRKVRI